MSSKVYKRTGGLNPGRSVFDLSYDKKFTADLGKLYPVMCEEVVPGDHFKIGSQAIVRFQPMVAPVLHEINMYVHYFFVPYRILWEDWEDFISGGVNGTFADPIPTWEPTVTTKGSLWDYMGFPTGIDPDGAYPIDFPRRAYNLVYNEYYRDENLITEVALTNETILNRAWEKDYFTSALTSQQRGTAPALPISGTTSAVWTTATSGDTTLDSIRMLSSNKRMYAANSSQMQMFFDSLNDNTVDLSTATTFDISDLRLAFQIQKWMERNNRAGVRYTEFLKAHFGVSPRDDRLQRPEYIGGSKTPVVVSEVLQTSATDSEPTPQGNMAGHGMAVNSSYAGKYTAYEFGLIIGIMSVMPRSAYQNGINRQWLKETKYDFYFPEFSNLSEQAIINAEICAKNADATHNAGIFGYQGRYDELRTKSSMVCGDLRDTYDYWHIGRQFDPASPPVLNQSFVECVPDKRFLAATTEPAMIINFGNLIHAVRPLPAIAEPGLIDHN